MEDILADVITQMEINNENHAATTSSCMNLIENLLSQMEVLVGDGDRPVIPFMEHVNRNGLNASNPVGSSSSVANIMNYIRTVMNNGGNIQATNVDSNEPNANTSIAQSSNVDSDGVNTSTSSSQAINVDSDEANMNIIAENRSDANQPSTSATGTNYNIESDGTNTTDNTLNTADADINASQSTNTDNIINVDANISTNDTIASNSDENDSDDVHTNICDFSNECIICLSNYEDIDKCSQLPCQHIYHTECIEQWLSQSRICPICRVQL